MNRNDARKVADVITNQELLEMLNSAKEKITDWKKISNVNKGITKGTAWNILAKDFNASENYHIIAKTNLIREFGEFLPKHLKPKHQAL